MSDLYLSDALKFMSACFMIAIIGFGMTSCAKEMENTVNLEIYDFKCDMDYKSCKELAKEYLESKSNTCQVKAYKYMSENNSYKYRTE